MIARVGVFSDPKCFYAQTQQRELLLLYRSAKTRIDNASPNRVREITLTQFGGYAPGSMEGFGAPNR